MIFGFAARLSWVLALAGILTAGLTGVYVYRSSHELLVQSAKEELASTTNMLDRRLDLLFEDVMKDLNFLARHPASQKSLQTGKPDAENDMAKMFELLIANNPAYLQIRLISANEYGLEKVRVDRDKTGTVRVVGDDLQEKGYLPFVSDTLTLPPGSTYLSPIAINHERGSHSGLNRPTATFASPVGDAAGHAMGVIAINLDLNNAFASMAADLPKSFSLFLANQQGDFLIHPEMSQTFGFDRGQSILLQNEFPAATALVEGKTSEAWIEARTGRYTLAPMVAVFHRDVDKDIYGTNRVFVGVGEPLQHVLAKAEELGKKIIWIVGVVGMAGIALAVVLARFVTNPINKLNDTVANFSVTHDLGALAVKRRDELGQLARNFLVMQQQIKQQFAELQKSHKEMEELARHDALTNLPNRRHFLECFQSAIARSLRTKQPLALLFIDLDKFKHINDHFGHEAGDEVLRTVAQRLSANVRGTDTVARLGGDEFVVLLENITNAFKVVEIATNLCTSMAEPLLYADQYLHIGMSVGVSLYPQDGTTLDELIKSADRAMYEAKADSDRRVHFATPPMPIHV